ncbi:MAG: restriction endonuclease [Hyphomicrobiales bacterium]|nr:restriction endonuclease [Hyphomicrobiales bacterium]
MGIPGYDKITRPLLKYLIEENKVVELAVIREEVARMFYVTEEDQQERLNSGEKRFANHVRWVAHDMRSAGLLRSPQRGCFEVTQEGKDKFESGVKLSRKYLKQRHQELKQQRQGILSSEARSAPIKSQRTEETAGLEASDERNEYLTPDEEIENALEQIDEALAVELLERTYEIGHKRFEQLTVDLLVKMGYGKGGKRTGGPKDGGIDGIIYEDELGFIQIGIQAKCNAEDNKVSGGEMNKFSGALERKGLQKGVFVTTSSFTSDADNAAKEVTGQGKKSIITINGEQLAKLMIKHGIGCEGKTLVKNMIDKNFWQLDEK